MTVRTHEPGAEYFPKERHEYAEDRNPVKASDVGGAVAMILTEDSTYVSIATEGYVSGGVHMPFSEPYNSLGAILTASEARQIEDTLRKIREWAEARGTESR